MTLREQKRVAKFKIPKVLEYTDKLPRTDAGKLYKRHIQERYWPKPAAGTIL